MNGTRSRLRRVIASRTLKRTGGELEEITVCIGAPRRRRRAWECLFLIEGLGKPQIQSVGGGDALQALLLAIEGVRVALEKTGDGYIWLDIDPEIGSGIPHYIPTDYGRHFEARINSVIEREAKRIWERRLKARKVDIAEYEAELKQREEVITALRSVLERRKAVTASWEGDLKKWKPRQRRSP